MTLTPTIAEDLVDQPWGYDFFRAVQLVGAIESLRSDHKESAWEQLPPIRFRAPASTSFPPSAISSLTLDESSTAHRSWDMEVNFLGLTGPSGVLPRHYTELVIDLARHGQGSSRNALRDWLDRFNNRFVQLFYLAWEKYRFSSRVVRSPKQAKQSNDPFSEVLRSIVGVGLKSQRGRLLIRKPNQVNKQLGWPLLEEGQQPAKAEATIAPARGVNDLALLHYGGLISPRRRSARSIEQVLADYFQLPLKLRSFQGQWLYLEKQDRTRLGTSPATRQYNQLGGQAVVGERVWDLQSKFRVELGPLTYEQFEDFLPRTGSGLAALDQFSKVLAGPTLDFDVQLILRHDEVPRTQLTTLATQQTTQPTNQQSSVDAQPSAATTSRARLGYNTWLTSTTVEQDKSDLVISPEAKR